MKGLKVLETVILYLAIIAVVWVVVSSITDAASSSEDIASGLGAGSEMFGILSGMGILALFVL